MGCFLLSVCFACDPYLEKQLYIIRDPATNRPQFRKAMKNIGFSLASNIAKRLQTKDVQIKTVLNTEAKHTLIDEPVVLVTILRAGLPMLDGMMKVFEEAEVGFLAMKRNEHTLKPTLFYQGMPSLEGKTVILVDPMIATGGSMLDAVRAVEKLNPKKIIVAGVVSTMAGIECVQQALSSPEVFSAAIDPELNEKGYIVPGLGDAGDRAFGIKVD
jgi:uracil phosphoribosyltransferase